MIRPGDIGICATAASQCQRRLSAAGNRIWKEACIQAEQPDQSGRSLSSSCSTASSSPSQSTRLLHCPLQNLAFLSIIHNRLPGSLYRRSSGLVVRSPRRKHASRPCDPSLPALPSSVLCSAATPALPVCAPRAPVDRDGAASASGERLRGSGSSRGSCCRSRTQDQRSHSW